MTNDAVTDAVLAAVRETVTEVNPTCHASVTLDSSLDRDLGLDSLVRAELLTRIEDALGRRVSDSLLVGAETPRDLIAAARHGEPRAAAATVCDRRGELGAALPGDVRTLVEALEWHASEHPERVHVQLLGEDPAEPAIPLTYGVLRDRGRAIAAGLTACDVRPGDTVAIMLATGIDYFVAFIGVLFAGAIPVPLYPPARPAQLEDYLRRQIGILDNAQTAALITSLNAGRVARVLRAPVASLRRITTAAELEHELRIDVRPPVRADDVALLQYTSGSTGSPKGVVLTHSDLLANIRAMAQAARADASDVFVSWLPLYHDMGLIGAWLGSLCIGFPLVVMSPLSFLVRPARWLRAISDHRATLSAAPNFGFELCARKVREDELEGIDLSSLRMVFNGAEPVSADTLDRFAARFGRFGLRAEMLAPVYGLAEAAVGLAFPPPGRPPLVDRIERDPLVGSGAAIPAAPGATDALRVVACGQPLPGYQIRIVNRAGSDLDDRHEGRIEFRGPSATRGYFRNPEQTHRLFDGEWLDTGDLGYLARGDIYLTGRAKDLIIRAGRNLHPEALEEAVGAVSGVRPGCVAVFAIPDPQAGTERLVVAAETRVRDPAAREAMRAAIVEMTVDVLGTPPDDVVLPEPRSVPKTSSGKIRRAACRDLYERHKLAHPARHPRLALARLELRSWMPRTRDVRHAASRIGYLLYVWLVTLALALPTAVALILLPRGSWRFAVLRQNLRLLARLAGVHVTLTGRDQLPRGDGAVLVANHPSWIDGAVLASVIDGTLVFVVGAELGRARWSGLFLRRLGVEFVQRATPKQGAADTRRLIAEARAGCTLVIFPEGRLSQVPGLRAFRFGAFLTAAEARRPVVPIAIRGTRTLLPPGHRTPHRASVIVHVGEQISTEQPGWAGAVELQHATREWILAHCEEPDIA
jgi:1-acyl-sn-glycerol-3-phosphate acyltransferase